MKLEMIGWIKLEDLVRLSDRDKRDAAARDVLGIPLTRPVIIDDVLLRAKGGCKPLGIYAGSHGVRYITISPLAYGIYNAIRVREVEQDAGRDAAESAAEPGA